MIVRRPGRQIPTLEELAAFADGGLSRRDARRVAAHLRASPADADRVRAYLALDARLREAHAGVLDEPLPEAVRRLLEPRSESQARLQGGSARAAAAAAVAVAAALGVLVWLSSAGDRSDAPAAPSVSFVAAALDAYHDSIQPVGPGPNAAAAPDLARLGLRLEATRELRRGGHRFAEYAYRDRRDRRVVLYESADAPLREGVLRIVERESVHVAEWTADHRHYAMVGDRTVAGLAGLAASIRRDTPAPALAVAPEAPLPAAPAPGVTPPSSQGPAVAGAGAGAAEASPPAARAPEVTPPPAPGPALAGGAEVLPPSEPEVTPPSSSAPPPGSATSIPVVTRPQEM